MGYLPKKAATRSGNSPRERNILHSTKLKGFGDVKSTLTTDMEMQSLAFAQVIFTLALFHYFLTMFLFLPFGMEIYNLCHYILDVCNLLFVFIL